MSVLTDLKSREVEDILITVTGSLNGFTDTDTIRVVVPQSNANTAYNGTDFIPFSNPKFFFEMRIA